MLTSIVVALLIPKQVSIEGRLKSALASVAAVRFSQEDGMLVVRYRTETVKAPRQAKSAQVMTEMVPEERPTLTGFKLETRDFPHPGSEPSLPEQAVRMNPNWLRDYGAYKMDAVERQVDGAEMGRYYNLKWGSKADPRMIAKVRAVLEKGTHPMRGG